MVTSISCGYAVWMDGETFNATLGRTYDVAGTSYSVGTATSIAARSGVVPAGAGPALQVNASSGMNITINPGYVVIQNTTANSNGAYRFGLMSQGTVTVTASDPTNPRIDIVVAQVVENGDATSFSEINLIAGTPAGSPTAPATPAHSIVLAQIAVGATVTTINAGNITDKRVFTVAPGAILPIATTSAAPVSQNGIYMHDLSARRLVNSNVAGIQQVQLLPFTTAIAVKTTDTTTTGAEVTVLSLSVTTDGVTDLEIISTWFAITDVTNPNTFNKIITHMNYYIDSTQVYSLSKGCSGSTAESTGGVGRYQTTSLLSTTPSAGAHTITWKFLASGNGGDTIRIQAASTTPAQFIVKAVCL